MLVDVDAGFFQKTGGGSGGGDDDDDDKMNTLNLIMVFIIRNGEDDSDDGQYNDVMKETISPFASAAICFIYHRSNTPQPVGITITLFTNKTPTFSKGMLPTSY